jgi:hypothetical protein
MLPDLIPSHERNFSRLFLYVSSMIVSETGIDNNLGPVVKKIR